MDSFVYFFPSIVLSTALLRHKPTSATGGTQQSQEIWDELFCPEY